MGKTDILTKLPLAIAAFLLSNSDKVRRGESLLQENIETSNADGTWNATNFPSDGSRGVRVIFSPNERDLIRKRSQVAGLVAVANELRPKAHNRPKESDPKPVADGIKKDAKAALAELKRVEMEMDVLNEEIKGAGSSQTFTLPFHEDPYVLVDLAVPEVQELSTPSTNTAIEPDLVNDITDTGIAKAISYKLSADGTSLLAVKGPDIVVEVQLMEPITEMTTEADKTTLWNLAVEEIEKIRSQVI